MEIIKLLGKALYQWDTDRQIEITPDDGIVVDEIHYATVMLREALVVLPHVVDGTYIADIPNILLQSANTIHIYVVTHTANGERTIDDTTLGVTRRKKPSDYVYTETEVMRYENLESRIKELEDNQVSDETLNEMVQNYLTKNPIKIDVDKELSEVSENPVENKAVAKAIQEVREKIPTDCVTNEELDKKGYLTEHQPLDGYAKKEDIPTELPASDVYEWAKKPTKPSYNASEVGADPAGTADTKISTHNTSDTAHNDIRILIKNLTTKVTALMDSDDETLDQTSEIVAYIKSNKSLIDAITTSKVSVDDIVDNLTTNMSNKPLSAKQGVALKSLIDEVKTALGKIVIPTKLPNPQKLTFDGAVSAEYDGSGAVVVTIPNEQGTERIEKNTADTDVTLEPNKLYVFPEMAELSVDLEANPDTDIVSEYHFIFTSGSTATVLSLPEDVKVPSNFLIESNKAYEISILEMMMLVQSWEIN